MSPPLDQSIPVLPSRRLLLLGGGTVLGAVQCVPLQEYFKEQGYPHTIVGSSIGSVGAAAFMTGKLDVLEDTWNTINSTSDFQSLNYWPLYKQQHLGWMSGLFNFNPLFKLIQNKIGDAQAHCKAFAAAVDLAEKEYVLLPLHNALSAWRALHVVASCAQVPIHGAPIVNDRPMGDGGILHVIPRMSESWHEITVIACSPISISRIDNRVKSHDLSLMRSLEIALDQHELLDYVWLLKQAQKIPVCIVEPSERPGKPFDASKKSIKRLLYEIGPQAWQDRYYLPKLTDSEILKIVLT